jgi:hypothetical protein
MAALGGFFAVSYLAERTLTDALDAAWRTRWRDARGAMAYAVPTPFGDLVASGGVSLDRPSIALVGSVNAVRVRLSATARLDLRLGGNAVGGVFVQTAIVIDVPIVVDQHDWMSNTKVDLSGFTLNLEQLRLTWFDGPFDGRAEDAILSDASRNKLTDELRRRAQPYLTFTLPTDRIWQVELSAITAGGGVHPVPFIRFGGVRILDGWLALGVDDTGQVQTHGNPAAIGLPPPEPSGVDSSSTSLVLVLDTGIVQQYLNLNAKFALILGIGSRTYIHPSGDPSVIVHDDVVDVTSVGGIDAPDPFSGTVPYSANIKVRPYVAEGSQWIYASVSPDIRVDAPWYLSVLADVVDFFGGDVFAKLRRANKGTLATLFKAAVSLEVPNMPGLSAGISARKIVLRPDLVAIYGEAWTLSYAKPPSSEVKLIVDPPSIHIRDRFLQLTLPEFWTQLLATDPTFRLKYEIRRGSDGAVVMQGAGWSGPGGFTDRLDLWDQSIYLETSYDADVVLERPPGTELARTSFSIEVLDLFDRAHPYVRWHRQHLWFDHQVPRTEQSKERKSAIHKTAIRERCKFCDAGERTRPSAYVLQPLDRLPPPHDPKFSDRLCRYCFGVDNG